LKENNIDLKERKFKLRTIKTSFVEIRLWFYRAKYKRTELRLNERNQSIKVKQKEEGKGRYTRRKRAGISLRLVSEDEASKGYYRIIATSNYQLD